MSKPNKDNKTNGPSNPTDAVPNFLYREPTRITQQKGLQPENQCDCEFCSCENMCTVAFDRLDSLAYSLMHRMEYLGLFASNVVEMHERILGGLGPSGFPDQMEMNKE